MLGKYPKASNGGVPNSLPNKLPLPTDLFDHS